jgi:hypothetical protein
MRHLGRIAYELPAVLCDPSVARLRLAVASAITPGVVTDRPDQFGTKLAPPVRRHRISGDAKYRAYHPRDPAFRARLVPRLAPSLWDVSAISGRPWLSDLYYGFLRGHPSRAHADVWKRSVLKGGRLQRSWIGGEQ